MSGDKYDRLARRPGAANDGTYRDGGDDASNNPTPSCLGADAAYTHGMTAVQNEVQTSPQDRRLIDMRHGGASWGECADAIGKSRDALEAKARRLRDAGQWVTKDGSPARGAPKRGKRGRPRNPIPSVSVSPRFAPEVIEAVRTVARCAGVREGEVVSAAMQRAVDRARGEKVSATPLGLDPGEPFDLCDGTRSETLSVNVPQPVYDALLAECADPERYMSTLITDVVQRLLADLNYCFVECEAEDG